MALVVTRRHLLAIEGPLHAASLASDLLPARCNAAHGRQSPPSAGSPGGSHMVHLCDAEDRAAGREGKNPHAFSERHGLASLVWLLADRMVSHCQSMIDDSRRDSARTAEMIDKLSIVVDQIRERERTRSDTANSGSNLKFIKLDLDDLKVRASVNIEIRSACPPATSMPPSGTRRALRGEILWTTLGLCRFRPSRYRQVRRRYRQVRRRQWPFRRQS
jgi:hypothetical protein